MPDVSLVDISEGVRTSWGNVAAITAVIPATKLYFQRVPTGTALPYATFAFDDVSAFYGGTEYFSGAAYIKKTRVNFKIYATRSTDLQAFATIINNAFGFEQNDPDVQWTIPNATVIMAVPEVEKLELEDELVDGQDVIRYETSFTLTLQADRG